MTTQWLADCSALIHQLIFGLAHEKRQDESRLDDLANWMQPVILRLLVRRRLQEFHPMQVLQQPHL